jgi:hypothetical protein
MDDRSRLENERRLRNARGFESLPVRHGLLFQ